MSGGTVYTETVVWSAPEQYVAEAPYQIAIILLDDGPRVTGRIQGDRVAIDDHVDFIELRNEFPVFRKSS